MRIGLYGLPTAGKTYVLDRIDFIEVVVGSKLLRSFDPKFDNRDEAGKEYDRREVAKLMLQKKDFIMDGHYAFGDKIVFTEEEGDMYDVYLYLYIDPVILKHRMEQSTKNQKYAHYDISMWQKTEIEGLRDYCHIHKKDFYVLDNPNTNSFNDVSEIISFIKIIINGYSCVRYAKEISDDILSKCDTEEICITDGDKTLTFEDTSRKAFSYITNIFDNNFYSGFQAWKQSEEFKHYNVPDELDCSQELNYNVVDMIGKQAVILTSGHGKVWTVLADKIGAQVYYGNEMSADTKYFVTKFLQENGRRVKAFGDSMNDYYMLLAADTGYLVHKGDGSISRSLAGKSIEGVKHV